jgi:predicted permease
MGRPLLTLLLGVIDAGRWLAPPSRRREWRRQWRADIWHEWRWVTRERRTQRPQRTPGSAVFVHLTSDVGARAALVRRTTGALRHAFWLRLHVRSLEMITHDLRYGWRMMLRQPGFTAAAVLTLGLGIGANVTMFSWVDATLRRQLNGVADADRFVALNNTTRTRNDISLSYPDFVDYRNRRPDSIDDLIAYTLAPMNLRDNSAGAEPLRVFGQIVSGNYFDVLGIRAPLGRTFSPEEDRTPNAHPVVVFSHNFWQRRFGGDPSIVGRTVTLNGRAFTVIGVGPAGFRGTEPYLNLDLWVPMMMHGAVMTAGDRIAVRGSHWLEAMVKLKPGATIARAQADLDVLARDLAAAYPDDRGFGVELYEMWRAPSSGGARVAGVMAVQLGVAVVVLLIACANVANLLLARAATRQRETAVRLTLGASRARVVRQLLTESTLLALAGGVAGTALAYWTADLIQWFIPPAPLPIEINPAIGRSVLVFAIALTTLSVLFFGLVPALQGSSSSVVTSLKESAAAVTASPRRARVRKMLVVAQVALSLVLLVSAGLFLRSLQNAQALDPGFSTRNGLLASVDLLPAGYDTPRGRVFFETQLSRVRELPGVEAATLTQRMPLGFGGTSDVAGSIDGYTPAPNEEIILYFNRVGSDYLKTMGIGVLAGRDFTDRDTGDRSDVVIVNETAARRYFAGRNAIGGRIRIGQRTMEIVGVARDGKYSNIMESPRPFMYLPVQQWYRADTVLAVKTAGNPTAIVPAVQQVLRSMDTNIPLFDIRTVTDHLAIALFVQRMVASLLGVFGLIALVLATVGLYGVIAGIVTQRTPEIGMRVALGATHGDIVSLILRQGLAMTGLGVAIGLGGAFAVTRLFKSLLLGVSTTDIVTFGATTALLVAVTLVATYLPARRAASVDPLAALRYE